MKIMLVDDSRTMRNIEKAALSSTGDHEFVEAGDGQDALSRSGAEKLDLILLDWNMPNMDGITFLRKFRESDKSTPIIMVTTEAEKSRIVEAIKSGVNNYVVKPFTPESLVNRVQETLDRMKAA